MNWSVAKDFIAIVEAQRLIDASTDARQGLAEGDQPVEFALVAYRLCTPFPCRFGGQSNLWPFASLDRTPLTDTLMYGVTVVMTSGFSWILGLMLAALVGKRRGRQALRWRCHVQKCAVAQVDTYPAAAGVAKSCVQYIPYC